MIAALLVLLAPPVFVDEVVIVDGEIEAVSLERMEMVIERPSGKSLKCKLERRTEVKLDGEKATLQDLKVGQTIRAGVCKRGREVHNVFIYEVTTRP